MALQKCIFATLILCCTVKKGYGYHSCKDLKLAKPRIKSGENLLCNRRGQQCLVYCDFHCHHGYMFVSKATSEEVNLKLLEPSRSEVLLRHLLSNGHQYYTMMKQLTSYAHVPLSIQYNKNVRYTIPVNRDTMGRYIYLGFLPKSVAYPSGSIQGYQANDHDYTFTNCAWGSNSYLAFFVNPHNRNPNVYYKQCCYTKLMTDWVKVGKGASKYLPSMELFFPV